MPNRSTRGVSLVQVLAAVVVVAALLAAGLVWHTRRRAVRQRMRAEVLEVFAAFRAQLAVHLRQHGSYLPREHRPPNDAAFWPSGEPDDEPDVWDGPGKYAYLTALGVVPKGEAVACRYAALMGDAGDGATLWADAEGCMDRPCASVGAEVFGTSTLPIEPWYYLRAQCNLEGREGGEASWYEWRARMDTPHVWIVRPAP